MQSSPAGVLALGDRRLRETAQPVRDVQNAAFRTARDRLQATLEDFRRQHGFGRAIAAPQIGVPLRFVALHLERGPFVMLDPEIVWRSRETMTLWDDCMSFPTLLVRVRRWQTISLRWTDEQGRSVVDEGVGPELAELLQHEIDHLDGVLAVDRAVDDRSLISREAFVADPQYFVRQVDYVIPAYRSLR